MAKSIKQPVQNKIAKVPVVMQMEMLECGAACLCMVLAYYDKWITLEQMRIDCGVSRDGSNAKNIVLAARNHGLNSSAYRFEPEELRDNGIFPCIVHWEFNHFIVVRGFRGNKVYINDPGRGNVVMSMEEFDKGFTGITLMFEPKKDFEPSGEKKSIIEYALGRIKNAKKAMLFVAMTTIIVSGLNMIRPGFLRILVDEILSGKHTEVSIMFLIGFSLIILLEIIVIWIQSVYSFKLSGKLAAVSSTEFMNHALRLPVEFYSQRLAGDVMYRAQSNSTIVDTLVKTFVPLFLNGIMMIFYLIVMFRYSIMLSVVGILGILINAIVAKIIAEKRVNITRVMMSNEGKLSGTQMSGIQMIETIKASGAENGFFAKWSGYLASVNTQQMRYAKLDSVLGIIPMIVTQLTSVAVLLCGVYLVMQGNYTVGMLMAFHALLESFLSPANQIIDAGAMIQEMRTDMERIEDVMKYEEDNRFKNEKIETSNDKEIYKLSGNIEIKNLTFGYSHLAPPLIEGFNLTLKQGQKVALVGGSGCGKSTIAKLLTGLYNPWDGEILYDGTPISDIEKSVFTGSVAVVDQDIYLFEDTISNNIKMWDNSIEDFEVIMAARDASLHDDITKRPGAYQYKLLEGGKDLSGGQKQRMEIARALAADPTIVILDEATSALDAVTEYEVVKSITDRGITCVVVAHRLSTIRDCDEIIVLDKGKVVDRGTHEELYARKGLYFDLISNE